MTTIDPLSPIPKYLQLREILLDLIEEAAPRADAPIPSERDLARQYGLSRMTVRAAVDRLASEGRLTRIQGKGTFTARQKIEMRLRLESFTDDMRARGMAGGARVLSRRVIRAPARVARVLGVAPGSRVHLIERLRTADGEPMAVERSHIPAALAPGLSDIPLSGRSLYTVLGERFGIVLDRGEQTIEAGLAGPGDAALLGLGEGSAVLLLQRWSFAGRTCVELTVSTYRGDRYRLRAALQNP